MWPRAPQVVAIVLATITPGVVLTELQAWTPVVLGAAALAGTAVAVAGIAWSKASQASAQVTALASVLPRRSTDVIPSAPPLGVPATLQGTGRAAVVDSTIATLPLEGGTK